MSVRRGMRGPARRRDRSSCLHPARPLRHRSPRWGTCGARGEAVVTRYGWVPPQAGQKPSASGWPRAQPVWATATTLVNMPACVPRMAILGPEGKEAIARHCARAASLTFIAASRFARVKDWANVTLISARGAYVKRSPATNSADLRWSAGCAGSRLGGPELQASCIGSWRQWARAPTAKGRANTARVRHTCSFFTGRMTRGWSFLPPPNIQPFRAAIGVCADDG